jgi:hypothetical protein
MRASNRSDRRSIDVGLRTPRSESSAHRTRRPVDSETGTAQSAIGRIYQWIALMITGGVIAQFFLAGVGLFGAGSYEAHTQLGWSLHTASMVGFVAALVLTRTIRAIAESAALLVALTIQVSLPGLRDDAPWLAALHPLMALVILCLAATIGMPALRSNNIPQIVTRTGPSLTSPDVDVE